MRASTVVDYYWYDTMTTTTTTIVLGGMGQGNIKQTRKMWDIVDELDQLVTCRALVRTISRDVVNTCSRHTPPYITFEWRYHIPECPHITKSHCSCMFRTETNLCLYAWIFLSATLRTCSLDHCQRIPENHLLPSCMPTSAVRCFFIHSKHLLSSCVLMLQARPSM